MNLEKISLFTKKFIISIVILTGIGVLPACAKIDGRVFKSHICDTENTIMPEMTTDMNPKTSKYWDKNLFYQNKYKPLFMLSNKDLVRMGVEKRTSTVQRIVAPSVYSISLKTASIKGDNTSSAKISALKTKNEVLASNIIQTKTAPVTALTTPKKPDVRLISMYEESKNQGVEADKKIETALTLKESKNKNNYSLAIDLLDDVTRMEPYNAYAYYLKGELYIAQSDKENAIKNYTEALKLNPCSKQSCLGIAKILELTNKDLAQKYYNMANND